MSESAPKPPTTFRVHLVDQANVVERGEKVTVWFMPFADTWIRAKDHPDAIIDEASSDERSPHCPPGTIWHRTVDLSLPPRTPLLCRITRPLIENLTAIEYMTRERRGMRRHVQESWYIVTGNYRLSRSQEPDSFAEARKAHEEQAPKPEQSRPSRSAR